MFSAQSSSVLSPPHRFSFLVYLTSADRPTFKCCGNEKTLQSTLGKMGSSVLTRRPKPGRLKCWYIIHDNVYQSSKPCRCFFFFCDWDCGNRSKKVLCFLLHSQGPRAGRRYQVSLYPLQFFEAPTVLKYITIIKCLYRITKLTF